MKKKIGNEPATLPTNQCYKCRFMFVNRYVLTPNKKGELICDNCNEPPMTLQKKLDDLGDRLNKNYEGTTSGGFRPKEDTEILITAENKDGKAVNQKIAIVGGESMQESRDRLNRALGREDNPYDLQQKGLQFDALKKRNNELLRILKELHNRYENALYNQPLWDKAKQLINNK